MCVAVVIETQKGPSQIECWQMDDANPHGVGLAWGSGELVRYRKGLTWMEAYDLLQRIPRPALMHFRWATHGGRARHLTHPFPLGPRALTSRKLNAASKAVLIHNGVWTNYLRHMPPGVKTEKWSDTAVAAYAAGVHGEEILDDVDWATATMRAISDNGAVDIVMRGHWQEHEGNMYSNLTWQPRAKSYYTPSRGSWGGGYDFDDETNYFNYGEPVTIGKVLDAENMREKRESAFEEWKRKRDEMKAKEEARSKEIDTWLAEYEAAQKAIRALPALPSGLPVAADKK